MRISHRHKFVFISIPKTASTSMRKCLAAYSDVTHKKSGFAKHMRAYEARGRFDELGWDWDAYFKFCFVRNPWDRLLSKYFNVRKQLETSGRRLISFHDWIVSESFVFYKPQMDMVVDPSGAVLLDFIGRFENIDEDWKTVCEKIGLTIPLPHVQWTAHGHYSDYYTQETKEIVGRFYEKDIDFFGYEFEKPAYLKRKVVWNIKRHRLYKRGGGSKGKGKAWHKMGTDNPLYIFFHIHGTAGSTFKNHIEINFPEHESLAIYHNKKDIDAFDQKLSLQPKALKELIRVIYGHRVYASVHTHFKKPSRYITFLRNPVDRIVSRYNWDIQRSSNPKRRQAFLPLDQWLKAHPSICNGMVWELLTIFERKKLDERKLNRAHLEEAKRILDMFYFVGITEDYDQDALFLYHELGVKKFTGDKNVRKKYFVPNEHDKKLILSTCELDQELYEYALGLNRQFKEKRNDFARIVSQMQEQKDKDKWGMILRMGKAKLAEGLLSMKTKLRAMVKGVFYWNYRKLKDYPVMTKLIKGKRVLIIGSGPSCQDLNDIPEDIRVLTCNRGPRLLIDKKIDRKIDFYLCHKGKMMTRENILQEVLPKTKIQLFFTDDFKYARKQKELSGIYDRLVRFKTPRYPLTRLEKKEYKSVFEDAARSLSRGMRLLLYALYFDAREIYVVGIDLHEGGYFWGEGQKSKHLATDTAFLKAAAKQYKNIYSLSQSSPVTKYIPHKRFD